MALPAPNKDAVADNRTTMELGKVLPKTGDVALAYVIGIAAVGVTAVVGSVVLRRRSKRNGR